jgi:FMN phosphatase YigB (HAD superfamily)
MLKTDSDCFPHIIKCLGVDPEKMLLIDDSVEKVLMAQKYGLQVHQFTDHVQLKDYLTSKGIL